MVVLLTLELDGQLLVALHENTVIVVNLLRDLRHGLEMFVQLLLFLLEVVLVILFLLQHFFTQLIQSLAQLVLAADHDFLAFFTEERHKVVLSFIHELERALVVSVHRLKLLQSISLNELSVLLLLFALTLNFLGLLWIIHVDTLKSVLLISLLFLGGDLQWVRRMILDLLLQLLDDVAVLSFTSDVLVLILFEQLPFSLDTLLLAHVLIYGFLVHSLEVVDLEVLWLVRNGAFLHSILAFLDTLQYLRLLILHARRSIKN